MCTLQINLRQAAVGQAQSLAALLRDEVHGSPAPVQYPYVVSQGGSLEHSLRPEAGALWVGGSCSSSAAQPLSGLPEALRQGNAKMLLLCVEEDCAAGSGTCMADVLSTVRQHVASKGLKAAFAYLPQPHSQARTRCCCLTCQHRRGTAWQ